MVASNRIVFLTLNNIAKYIPQSIRCKVAVATRKAEGSKMRLSKNSFQGNQKMAEVK